MPTKTDMDTFHRATRSVNGRLKRLKITRAAYCGWGDNSGAAKESPIAEIGCFGDEIDSMEKTLKSMQSRLERATVKIPD